MHATVRWGALLVMGWLVGACGGTDGGSDATGAAEGLPDTPAAETGTDLGAAPDQSGPLPLCRCPLVPAGGTCRSCSTLDNACEARNDQAWAIRCTIAKGCLAEESCADLGAGATCAAGVCSPGVTVEPEPEVVETAEPDVVETVLPGSKLVGQSCTDSVDCANAMTCVSGQYTMAHCNPMCATVEDCNAAYPGGNAQCAALTGGSVCIWFCGSFGGGATCPGDLGCDGATCG